MKAKILLIDIETAPNIAYVWGAWKQNVGQNQWVSKGYIMSYAAKWLGDDTIIYNENRTTNDAKILFDLFGLLNEADIVVAHHGDKFDLPTIKARGLIHGFSPPSPYHTVDTRKVAYSQFRFVSNSLANLCQELGLPQKKDHKKFPGFELWLECMAGNPEAWQEMKDYNIADVISLEALYLRLRPYINNHPNVAYPDEDGTVVCPKCGSQNIKWRGYWYSKAGLCYHKFQCMDCGGWGRVRCSSKDMFTNEGRNI